MEFFLSIDDLGEFQIYFDKLTKHLEQSHFKHLWLEDNYQAYKAKQLTENKDFIALGQAKLIYEKLLQKRLLTDIKLDVYEGLLEILVYWIKVFDEQKTLDEIKQVLRNYRDLAYHTDRFTKMISSKLIEYEMYLIEGKFEQSKQSLIDAKQLCEQNNLILLLKLVDQKILHLEETYIKWEQILQQNIRMGERLKNARIENYIKKTLSMIKDME